jgi:catechol 2,3-dioxygenase-like lactoylglutathione lyase family enzyme
MMEQRVSLITLGCRDPQAQAKFYEALGWARVPNDEGIVVFDLIGQALGLYPIEMLARDMGLNPDELGYGAATYAYNVADKSQVDEITQRARAAGAKILKEPHDVFWGGHISYFSDPEGHIWEVAYNPFSKLGPRGEFRWEGY